MAKEVPVALNINLAFGIKIGFFILKSDGVIDPLLYSKFLLHVQICCLNNCGRVSNI